MRLTIQRSAATTRILARTRDSTAASGCIVLDTATVLLAQ
jgi:hypothetical protein